MFCRSLVMARIGRGPSGLSRDKERTGMIKKTIVNVGVAAAVSLAAATAAEACPSWQLAPSFGNVQIFGGQLVSQPFVRNLGAGGGYYLPACGFDWTGYVAAAPDLNLSYAGGSLSLTFEVLSQFDTVLLIRSPEGIFYFADDTSGINPMLIFNFPLPGLYNIWVGTYGPGSNRPATLRVYETN
jgi:hypothetical protein